MIKRKEKLELEHALRACATIALWRIGALGDDEAAEAVCFLEDWLEPFSAVVHGQLLKGSGSEQ